MTSTENSPEYEALLDARTCFVCSQRDDHPRDWVVLDEARDITVFHHIDCGARQSPPCSGCLARLEASGNATGEALRAHLIGGQ